MNLFASNMEFPFVASFLQMVLKRLLVDAWLLDDVMTIRMSPLLNFRNNLSIFVIGRRLR